jgi:hypothetical protein
VDRWHPEIHTFHLSCDETTVTLQDVIMIIVLPIDGTSVCGSVPYGWRDSVEAALGIQPLDVSADQKDKKMKGVHSVGLIAHFDTCPKGAEDGVIQSYARSCF